MHMLFATLLKPVPLEIVIFAAGIESCESTSYTV